MAFTSSSKGPRKRDRRTKLDLEAMVSGLLMGVAAIGFAACMLLVLNGKASEWLKHWNKEPKTHGSSPGAGVK